MGGLQSQSAVRFAHAPFLFSCPPQPRRLVVHSTKKAAARLDIGGEGGIRTRDTLSSIHTFQACSFNHSDTSPKGAQRNAEKSVLAIYQPTGWCLSLSLAPAVPISRDRRFSRK